MTLSFLKKGSLLAVATLSLVATPIFAAESSSVQTVIDEAYVQPDYVLGYSLSGEQQEQTLNLLDFDDNKDTKLKTLTTDAYSNIMDVDGSSLQLYSSVKIEKLGASKPLEVVIKTPENITKVTQDMYRNAAVTLGITHAKITVASPIAVTGESALAGIYYSLEESGASISDESKSLASEELSTLATINAENTGKDGFDADKLNVALADIKAAIADSASKQLTKEDVEKIVDDTLTRYGIKDSMTTQHINLIVNFAINLSNSEIVNTANFKTSVLSLKDSIISKAQSTFKGINVNIDTDKVVAESKGLFSKIWQAIVDFFTALF